MYRNSSYDQDLARELKDKDFAQGFIVDLIEGDEGMSLQDALRHTIQSMGVAEYCKQANMSLQHVNAFLKSKRNPKPETLDALLSPFGLRTRIVVEKAS